MDAGVDMTHTDAGAIPANNYDPLRTAVQAESAVLGAGAGALSVVTGGGTGALEWSDEWGPYTADAQVASDFGFGFGAIAALVRGMLPGESTPRFSEPSGGGVPLPNLTELPGSAGIQVAGRLTSAQMEALTRAHGVEFALTYRTGAGRNGGGGTYWL
jgi:hypothetical protein